MKLSRQLGKVDPALIVQKRLPWQARDAIGAVCFVELVFRCFSHVTGSKASVAAEVLDQNPHGQSCQWMPVGFA